MTAFAEAAARQKVEDFLRLRLQDKEVCFREARERHRKLLNEQLYGRSNGSNPDVAAARQTELRAQAEFAFTLQLFAELIMNGKIPASDAFRTDGLTTRNLWEWQ